MAGIEPSRFAEGTVYAVFDGHRDDDFDNYIYKSIDYGRSWASIVGDLPAQRVVRAIKEDLRNPALLYIATEFGFFVSIEDFFNHVSQGEIGVRDNTGDSGLVLRAFLTGFRNFSDKFGFANGFQVLGPDSPVA